MYAFFFVAYIGAHIQQTTDHIKSFLKQYTRPITFLELGVESRYTAALAENRCDVGVMYSMQASTGEAIAQQLAATKLSNIVVLNSAQFGIHELQTIGRCEHFDVSIVDEDVFKQCDFALAMPYLLRLGDYLFCIVNESSVKVVQQAAEKMEIDAVVTDIPGSLKKICLCKSLKKGLDIARWNMHGMAVKEYKRYTICSNFSSKTLRKNSTHTTWIPGINMVTFIGCRGLLPRDTDIIALIGLMKKVEHNDLVLGNMIVQGNRLAIIDFDDARRNVRQRKCIRVAQTFFKSGIRFKKKPEEALHDYKVSLLGK